MCTFCPVCELVGNNLRAPRRAAIRLKERIKIHKVLRVPHPLPELQASIHSTFGLRIHQSPSAHPTRTSLSSRAACLDGRPFRGGVCACFVCFFLYVFSVIFSLYPIIVFFFYTIILFLYKNKNKIIV
jgi:hypothetical protein